MIEENKELMKFATIPLKGPKKKLAYSGDGMFEGRVEADDSGVVRLAPDLIGPVRALYACCWNKTSCSLRKKVGSKMAVRLPRLLTL
ncbi:MAG: hypothetical protein JSW59_19770 [Phycisphaerales bacterium]|nr:MAG: hypothetical protein JSW59_19770 [Phycisphaerales bacterium]